VHKFNAPSRLSATLIARKPTNLKILLVLQVLGLYVSRVSCDDRLGQADGPGNGIEDRRGVGPKPAVTAAPDPQPFSVTRANVT
jgi:hypothetical protein